MTTKGKANAGKQRVFDMGKTFAEVKDQDEYFPALSIGEGTSARVRFLESNFREIDHDRDGEEVTSPVITVEYLGPETSKKGTKHTLWGGASSLMRGIAKIWGDNGEDLAGIIVEISRTVKDRYKKYGRTIFYNVQQVNES